ncbi:hypothetical protein [Actinoplanes derwentensis]|uniref:Uncharacterized protein n=1 Tax=Actinoplanes derwentensis TaxID=113562 RepID=A0A1H2A132_9ACTN|nr:hypothetical protein [Actinoplanes derwentensis]GID83430.1 hypothetical protein Ade03nite_23540 [Actinoplanes derwentensis]SDT39708.1 hypothetical protein SAMN04489716_3610 [Actinoplanes derwentensis]
MRQRVGLILGVVMVLAGVGGVAGWRWWQGRAPYGPEALGARATVEFVDQATANAALAPVNAVYANGAEDQIVLGRVAWNRPPHPQPDGSLRIVLADKRNGLLPGFIAVTSAQPDQVITGMDSALETARSRYPWLGPARESADTMWAGSVVTVSSIDASPVTFQTVLREAQPESLVLSGPMAIEDLLVALICVGPDGQVYWAQRLLN